MGKKIGNEICQRVRQVRLETAGPRGKSSFSKQLGLSPSTYDYYESSRVPPAEVLLKIADLAGVDFRWLLTGEQPAGRAEASGVAQPIIQRAAELLGKSPDYARPLAAFLDILEAAMAFPKKSQAAPASAQPPVPAQPPQEHDVGPVARKAHHAGDAAQAARLEERATHENRPAAVDTGTADTTVADAPTADAGGLIPILGRSAAGVPQFWSDVIGYDSEPTGLTKLSDLIDRYALAEDDLLCRTSAATNDTSVGPARTVQIITLRQPVPLGPAGDCGVAEFIASGPLKAKYPDAFAVRIDGESMSPEIRHGDLVVLSASRQAVAGQSAVVQVAGAIGVTCKLYHPTGGRVHLVPINETFAPTTIEPGRIEWALQVLARIRPLGGG